MSDETRVVEYAQLMSGGGFNVRNGHPEIEQAWPIADWIKANSRSGGRVFRRVITVVEDWVEVTE